jgi:hypothetical protein
LLTYVVGERETFLWVVRRNGTRMHELAIGRQELDDDVADILSGVDPAAIETYDDIPQFATTTAFNLYDKLFTAAEAGLGGVRHLFVVPDGAVGSLPLGALVTEEPQAEVTDFAGYRNVPWLARRYALAVLPSVSSLRALRRFAKAARAKKPFLGIGDPLLDGHPGRARGVKLAGLFQGRGLADAAAVRALAALPDTAD